MWISSPPRRDRSPRGQARYRWRRRSSWYKVRTAAGTEGWTSDRELLDSAQMQRLQKLASETADLPSQGTASSFAPLNVHTEPNRQSASFFQIQPKEKFRRFWRIVWPKGLRHLNGS